MEGIKAKWMDVEWKFPRCIKFSHIQVRSRVAPGSKEEEFGSLWANKERKLVKGKIAGTEEKEVRDSG
nr:hypothetical protein Iba_chr01bCG9840 [Ipomoea batatas]